MLIQEEITIPVLSGETPRRLFIWLPEEAEESGDRYPVLYMFDGHNVFLDETATYGRSWRMQEYLEEQALPLIVVGVECNHEGNRRLEEYSPFDARMNGIGRLHGQGNLTMDWIVDELKPAIDAHFPTQPEREHTAIAGSSMGGLMALFAVTAYNYTFSRAAALSPSIWVAPNKLVEGIKNCPIEKNTRVYMDYGTRELGNHNRQRMLRGLERVHRTLLEKDVAACMRIVPGGTHSEASWERQVPIFLRHLGLQE
ncbi:MAG: alpha/beta hydrolase [Lachnospiraceae bacterium]|nr:alpha/beta hydrolase [Lachnospiraceae bacterium]